jgi:dTDP-4-amino-4,6-dideoxygalactose transaminase
MEKIFLSPPNINVDDITALGSATNFNSPEVANLYVERFENELAVFNGVKTVVALNSGTSALHLGLIAMGIKPGDKIILPTLLFIIFFSYNGGN